MTTDDDRSIDADCDEQLGSVNLQQVLDAPVRGEVAVFSALANDTRYRILRLIMAADGEVCGCELEPRLDVAQSTVSQSLSRLHDAGLLTRTKDGRWRYYDTTPVAEALVETLEENEEHSVVPA